MPDEKFEISLLRFVAAELYFSLGLQVAQEMYGKSYFSLGLGEKAAVNQAVLGAVGGTYQTMTPEFLMAQVPKPPVGFQPPAQTGTGG
jgi:hypothetical protein